jgi:hypothetical protein
MCSWAERSARAKDTAMTAPLPSRFARPALAALACALLASGCGGGGGSSPVPPLAVPSFSQLDATTLSANAANTSEDTALAVDTVVETTSSLALAMPAGVVSGATVACNGGGSATLSIRGGTLAGELDGRLDAGEHYSVVFSHCSNADGSARLDGSVELDVLSADRSTSPETLAVGLTVSHLALGMPSGTVTLDGTASASRSASTGNGSTTTVSHISVPRATLDTAFNGRGALFTVSDLDATRTVTSVAGVTTASQFDGRMTLAGSADGRTLSLSFATTGNVTHDGSGALVSGSWTVVRPDATIATTVADGLVVMTVDDGNDGSIDHTWTSTTAELEAAAG